MSDKKKDARETYDFEKDVKYQREQYAKDDLIDTPYNKAKRYKIASEGVKTQSHEEIEKALHHKSHEPDAEQKDETPEGSAEK